MQGLTLERKKKEENWRDVSVVKENQHICMPRQGLSLPWSVDWVSTQAAGEPALVH